MILTPINDPCLNQLFYWGWYSANFLFYHPFFVYYLLFWKEIFPYPTLSFLPSFLPSFFPFHLSSSFPSSVLPFLFLYAFGVSLWNHGFFKKFNVWASLVVQWLRIHLPIQGTWVWALVPEDPTCHGATKPVRHNYWACVPQLLKPVHLEPVLRNKRSHHNEKPTHHNKE